MTKLRSTRPARHLVAVSSALLLGVVALVGPLPAGAADTWTTSLTVVTANQTEGLTLQVQGSGYVDLPNASTGAPNMGVYVALRDPATMTDDAINDDNGLVPALTYIPKAAIIGGNWTRTLTATAADIDVDAAWEVIVWSAHGNITDATLLDTVPVTLTDAQKAALDPGWIPPATTTVPSTTPTTTAPSASTTAPTTTAPSASTTAPATTRPSKPSPTSPGATTGPRCVTETVNGTAGSPQMSWSVKSSFVSYIESAVAKGTVETSGGVVRTGNGFDWPTGSGRLDPSGHGTWAFPGTVRFSGHDGALNLALSNLRVQVSGSNHGVLVADVRSTDMDGNDVGGTNVALADLSFPQVSPSGGTATVTLTAAGAKAFASYYEAGETLDPLTVRTSGGGTRTVEVCYDAQGDVVSRTPVSGGPGGGTLAATGSDDIGLVRAGIALIGVGAAAWFASTRRRRSTVRSA